MFILRLVAAGGGGIRKADPSLFSLNWLPCSGSLGIPGNQEDYFAAMPDDGAGYHPDGDAQVCPPPPAEAVSMGFR